MQRLPRFGRSQTLRKFRPAPRHLLPAFDIGTLGYVTTRSLLCRPVIVRRSKQILRTGEWPNYLGQQPECHSFERHVVQGIGIGAGTVAWASDPPAPPAKGGVLMVPGTVVGPGILGGGDV